MAAGTVGGATAAPLQTSWTRAEAACAARHRGDTYHALTHPAPAANVITVSSTPAPMGAKSSEMSRVGTTALGGSSRSDAQPPVDTAPLAPGFTLHL
jgi:hypothetical protein